ncbi:major capsid protein [Listeria phage LP-032]|uniref:Major capsid protein n=3 Tax=Homburgvirus TaxID=1921125 RepID=A0A059TAR4_9CAUD|nr:major head protein [Listeria phage LP-026]YP_009045162.1 major head protein [Listeria phage LP-114]AHL18696.1 major capsid protein [Listeria phage LP-114]AHL18908.1 major capsid protein [Listeria phage LP-032]AHN84797.1 major capsid protein [Listeria phage LP-026]
MANSPYQPLTMLQNMFVPQVVGPYLAKKMYEYIRFAPLATTFNQLQGSVGDTITLPNWNKIGKAEVVAEGQTSNIDTINQSQISVTVKKAVKAVAISDELELASAGNPVNEIVDQIAMALAQKVDDDLIAIARSAKKAVDPSTGEALTVDAINKIPLALANFGETLYEDATYLLVSTNSYALFVSDDKFVPIINQGSIIINGTIGTLYGCTVVLSDKVQDGEFFFIKAGALGIALKQDTRILTEYDLLSHTTLISGDRHYATFMADEDKIVYVGAGTAVPAAPTIATPATTASSVTITLPA